jgi:hypothetical protein
MTNSTPSKKISENLIYLIIWLMVFLLPILTLKDDPDFQWSRIVLEWIKISPFLLIFFINNSLLAPKFLLRNKNYQYIALVTVLIILVALLFGFSMHIKELLSPEFSNDIANRPFNPPPFHDNMPPPRAALPLFSLGRIMIDMIVFSYLVVGFNTAVKFVFKRQAEEKDIEKQRNIHLQTELSFLKNQVSPHFFMNTLNNIHSLIDYDSEIAKESIITLSKLMRHILYDSQGDKISLKKEMEFIRNYVELMKLRNSDKVKITLEIPDNFSDKMIPPLLFTSYIENAFKHGISFQIDSYINIQFNITSDQLVFNIENSNASNLKENGHIGIGIENSRKRLDLIYGKNYKLEIENKVESFKVNLTLAL